jgi:hypothetical protein
LFKPQKVSETQFSQEWNSKGVFSLFPADETDPNRTNFPFFIQFMSSHIAEKTVVVVCKDLKTSASAQTLF